MGDAMPSHQKPMPTFDYIGYKLAALNAHVAASPLAGSKFTVSL